MISGLVLVGTSCKKYLDINQNPNQADNSAVTPQLLLPQALTYMANNLNSFNTYGAQLGGYMANAGGYGGFGVSITYNFGTGNFTGLWSGTYDNLQDFQAIIEKSSDVATLSYYKGAAKVMKALGFQLLVDAYNDVPFTDALKGASLLTPKYDKAEDIYKALADLLDEGIADINTGNATPGVVVLGKTDVLFEGDMTKWKQLANTLKLRLIIRAGSKVTFTNTSFSSDGFLAADALINPGYTRDNGRQNPKWNTWGFSYTGTSGNKAWMPTSFILTFYNGVKLDDPGRGAALYYKYPSTPTNRLGNEGTSIVASPDGSFWYPAFVRNGASAGDTTGALKGPNAGFPLITAAESYFLQSEAVVKGLITGDAAALFNSGILASFKYLYSKPDGSIVGNPTTDYNTYLADNSTSPLVNFALAASDDQKVEAIITQKYIALNMVNSDEAWNEYRRTNYPKLNNSPSASGTETFASSVSESTRPDHLPTRILYPTTEGAYNGTNVPKNITPFTSLIFWAL